MMQFDFRNSGKSFFTMVVVLIILGIVFYVLLNFITDKKAKEKADLFMQAVYSSDLDSAKKMCKAGLNPKIYFPDEEKIFKYSDCGQGYYSPKKISKSYYVTGTPADARNVDLVIEKISGKWIVTNIHVNYHINRNVKQLAIQFVDLLAKNERQKARELTREVNNREFETLADFLLVNAQDAALLTKAAIIACTGKNCQQKPATTEFTFCNKTRCFSIITKHKEHYQYVAEVKLYP